VSRLSSGFIDLIISLAFIVIFSLIGVELFDYLQNNVDWYDLSIYEKKTYTNHRYRINDFKKFQESKYLSQFQIDSLSYVNPTEQDFFYFFPVDSEFSGIIHEVSPQRNEEFLLNNPKALPLSQTSKYVVIVPGEKLKRFIKYLEDNKFHIEEEFMYGNVKEPWYISQYNLHEFQKNFPEDKLRASKYRISTLSIDVILVLSYILLTLYILFCSLLFIIIIAKFESSKWQATIGKLSVGIKVVDEAGNRITYDIAFKRGIFRLVSIITLGIGYLWIFRKDHCTLHDIWSRTYVVDK